MFTYLLINLFAISIPLWRSFDKRIALNKEWKRVSLAILFPALFFIAWDILFTAQGVWGFNHQYLTGIFIFNLPLEECLFFVCIPYACIFTYVALNFFIKKDIVGKATVWISILLIVTLIVVGILSWGKAYTSSTFMLLPVYIVFVQFVLKAKYLGRFYLAYAVILIPFFIVNGVLTGTGLDEPVVWYDNYQNLGIRMGTIPVEDTFYGMLLILMNVSLFEWLKSREK